jgi:hypothetical protein
MPKIIVFLGLSLDGYIAGPNNELDGLRKLTFSFL